MLNHLFRRYGLCVIMAAVLIFGGLSSLLFCSAAAATAMATACAATAASAPAANFKRHPHRGAFFFNIELLRLLFRQKLNNWFCLTAQYLTQLFKGIHGYWPVMFQIVNCTGIDTILVYQCICGHTPLLHSLPQRFVTNHHCFPFLIWYVHYLLEKCTLLYWNK